MISTTPSLSVLSAVHSKGLLFDECTLAGERKADRVTPGGGNGIQLGGNRFLILYTTRSFRGRDDEWSVVYQLRAGGWDGPLLKEAYIQPTRNDWDAFGDGRRFVLQGGHPVAFGVPKGALVNGRRVPHENHFVLMWRVVARVLDPETGHLWWEDKDPDAFRRSTDAMWLQFRLNDAEDDLEVTSTPRKLRQKGYEEGPNVCADPSVKISHKGFVCPVPFNGDASEWVDLNSINGEGDAEIAFDRTAGRVLPAKYRWNGAARLYEWVEVGKPLGPDLFEGSIARYGNGFVISARMLGRGKPRFVAWCRVDDPFEQAGEVLRRTDQPNIAPSTLYQGPDGSLWRIGGCEERSPYQYGRDPIYLVRIDPENGFKAVEHWPVYDGRGDPSLRFHGKPVVDFGKLLPHCGGNSQTLLHRVRSTLVQAPPGRPPVFIPPEDIEGSGVYHAELLYHEEQPPMWAFAPTETSSLAE